MPKEFEGKVVVVTGGSRGIGRAIAVAFERAGAQTVLAAASAANLACSRQGNHRRGRYRAHDHCRRSAYA